MFPYILICSLSCVFAAFAVRYKKDIWLYRFLIAIAIILPCLLAGFRDAGVGTDTLVYGEKYFNYAHVIPIRDFFVVTDCEFLYGILVYVVAFFSEDIFWLYFVIQLIISCLVWKSIEEYLEGKYCIIGLSIYYLLFYSFSLNLMRQMIAMAIILFAFRYIRKKMLVKFLICLVLAVGMQKTSILAIVIYPIYQLSIAEKQDSEYIGKIKKTISKLLRLFRVPLILFGLLITVMVVRYGADLITFLHFYFDDFYAQYRNLQLGGAGTLRYTAYMCVIMFISLVSIRLKDTEFIFYVVMAVMNIILFQLKAISTESYRICLYFGFFIILCLPKQIKSIQKISNRNLVEVILFIVLFMYSYDFFVLQSYNETFPYTSDLLGIR